MLLAGLAPVFWLCALGFASTAAHAATGHAFLKSLTEGPPGNPLVNPEGEAAGAGGEVFVADGGLGVVDVFGPGSATGQFGAGVLEGETPGVAVDRAGDVYVADTGSDTVDVFKPVSGGGYSLLSRWTGAKTPGGSFAEVSGVAVDDSTSGSDPSAGNVYVVDRSDGVVDEIKPQAGAEGEFIRALGGKPVFEEPNGVAVDPSTGTVYVADSERGIAEAYSSAGVYQARIPAKGTLESVAAVGVEESSGDVYLADIEAKILDQYSAAGEFLGSVPGPTAKLFSEPRGVTVAANGDLYVADTAASEVDVFGPSVIVPEATTGKATKTTRTTTTLVGKVNPLGKAASYYFEYAEAEAFENTHVYTAATTAASAGSGSAAVKVETLLEGLKPETAYVFRLVAEGSGADGYGESSELETFSAVAGLQTGAATNVTSDSATLNGSLDGTVGTSTTANPEAKYYFEYGTTSAYGSRTAEAPAGEEATVLAAAGITGLKGDTVYHFRIVASDSFGTTYGTDASFKTSGPPQVTGEPAAPIAHEAATLNAEVNPGKLATEVHFEYGETAAYGTSTPEVEVPAGEAAVAEKAELTGLKLATTYHFRVVASNGAGTVSGPDQEFTTVLIESESALAVSTESATLQAQINPLGTPTTYTFEYGETTSYGNTAPAPEASAGSGSEDVTVTVALGNLQAGTTYHYRVRATVEGLGAGFGHDHTFTTAGTATPPAVSLPDGRAYEMVSPPNKQGAYIEPITRIGGAIQAAEDGSSLAYVVDGNLVENAEGNRSPESEQVLATRGASAWSSQELMTPNERPTGLRTGRPPEYLLFSSDLSLSVLQPFPFGLTPLAEPSLSPPLSEAEKGHQEKSIYVRGDVPLAPEAAESGLFTQARENAERLATEHGETTAGPGYVPLVTMANVATGVPYGGHALTSKLVQPTITYLSSTPDLSHTVFSSEAALAPKAPSAPGLYETGEGKLQLVSVLPDGSAAPSLTADLGVGYLGEPPNFRGAISTDGNRVFWTNDETSVQGRGHLYVRDVLKGETLKVDTAKEGMAQPEKGEAEFQLATPDGSKVFFRDTQALTASSNAAAGKADLYECEIVEAAGKLACNLTDLTAGNEAAGVKGAVLGASENGEDVYFVAEGVLASGAERGADNLYVVNTAGGTPATKLIGRLSQEDSPDWGEQGREEFVELRRLTARVSPNGRYLSFMSNRSLTGYDNTDVNEETGRHADEEVFVYDADAGSEAVRCVSCNPSGARPRGVYDTELAGEGEGLLVDRPKTWASEKGEIDTAKVDNWLAGSIPGWTAIDISRALYQSRYLSDSGRLFFTSADPLVPQANGDVRKETIHGAEDSVGVENVYEYEPTGIGSCTLATGCVSILSSGTSQKESAFLDATPSGNDVFFLTAAELLPQDQDSSYDIYDARTCSEGSPCQTPPSLETAPCASTSSCRPGTTSPPTFESPPSTTLTGAVTTLHLLTPPPKPVPTIVLTRAQKLAKALRLCHKLPRHSHAQKLKRTKCEAQAKKKYGAHKATAKRSSLAHGKGVR